MKLWLCFDHHGRDGKVWAVREGNTWHRLRHVRVMLPMETVYRGPQSQQPKAYLVAEGRLTVKGDRGVLSW